jgi:hypothetical protein
MIAERRITANRANAAESTRPVTPEGKQISSQNAGFACSSPAKPGIAIFQPKPI